MVKDASDVRRTSPATARLFVLVRGIRRRLRASGVNHAGEVWSQWYFFIKVVSVCTTAGAHVATAIVETYLISGNAWEHDETD